MTRRNARVVLRWILVCLAFAGLTIACAPEPQADSGSPAGVRIQTFNTYTERCIVATHDTAQGASIAMHCTPLGAR